MTDELKAIVDDRKWSKSMINDYKEIIVKEYYNEKGLITRREIGEELVRCKDCKFNKGKNKCLNEHSIIDIPKDTDYCSYGKKKEQENAD